MKNTDREIIKFIIHFCVKNTDVSFSRCDLIDAIEKKYEIRFCLSTISSMLGVIKRENLLAPYVIVFNKNKNLLVTKNRFLIETQLEIYRRRIAGLFRSYRKLQQSIAENYSNNVELDFTNKKNEKGEKNHSKISKEPAAETTK